MRYPGGRGPRFTFKPIKNRSFMRSRVFPIVRIISFPCNEIGSAIPVDIGHGECVRLRKFIIDSMMHPACVCLFMPPDTITMGGGADEVILIQRIDLRAILP